MITIRRAEIADADEIARCHVAAWRDSYRPKVSDQILAELVIDDYVAKWAGRIAEYQNHVLVARSETDVVGLLYGGPERSGEGQCAAEIYSIYVLGEFRRQGVGRKLFKRFARALIDRGVTSLLVWVFAENPCRAAYVAWGGELLERRPITVGDEPLEQEAYGWRDLRQSLST
jgi:ribosomal protein S18 acetylase RimI-like enzyme